MVALGTFAPSHPRTDDRGGAGFTLIERMIVMSLVVVLAGITISVNVNGQTRAREAVRGRGVSAASRSSSSTGSKRKVTFTTDQGTLTSSTATTNAAGSGGGRAAGTSVGRPRWLRMRRITGGSSMSASCAFRRTHTQSGSMSRCTALTH